MKVASVYNQNLDQPKRCADQPHQPATPTSPKAAQTLAPSSCFRRHYTDKDPKTADTKKINDLTGYGLALLLVFYKNIILHLNI
jgi:hypothetical protein